MADRSLATRLGADPWEDDSHAENCGSGSYASLAIENERGEPLTVTVDFGEDAFTKAFSLDPEQFVVERDPIKTETEIEATVTVGEEGVTVRWPARSCYQHGIALTPTGIRIGWVEPLSGWFPGHDCYPGDAAHLWVMNEGHTRTITATITDRCADATRTETFELGDEEGWSDGEVMMSGGMYDVTIDVEDEGSKTYEFYEECWGINTTINEDGDITMRRVPVM